MIESEEYFEYFITRNVNTLNRIEGSTLSYIETYAILWNDNSFTLNDIKPSDFYEAVNLKYANSVMLDAIRRNDQLTEALIIHFNETINENIFYASGYRQGEGISASIEVRERMLDLIEDFNNNDQIPLLEKVAHFHIMFEHIHPFEHGNGKTGRLLINFELIKHYQAPVIIPDERRVEYFNYISEYDTYGLTNMFSELQIQEMEKIEKFINISKQQEKSICK